MDREPTILPGRSARAWKRAVFRTLGFALAMIVIGAVSIGVHTLARGSVVGSVSLIVSETCAWLVFVSVLATLPLIIAMNLRERSERRNGYATIRTDSDVPFLEDP